MNDGMVETLPGVEVKAVRNATISVDKAEGIVEAFAAAVGNKDSVGDIIVPGAFAKSLNRRKPRVVWGHNWNEPIGKVLEITEVTSSDPRLPQKMKQAGVGGLFVKVQFNLNSERGREAFASVMFFGEDQEWSIGYKTIQSDFDPVKGAKMLKEVELYEVSPVLHGANNLTGTISVKSDDGVATDSTTSNDMSACEFSYGPMDADSKSFSFNMDEKEYFNGHSYERDDESDERRMVRKAFQQAFGTMDDVKFVDTDKVVFTRPGEGMWMSKYRRQGRRIELTRPVRARSQLVYMPVEVTPAGPPVIPPAQPMAAVGNDPHRMGACPKCGYVDEHKLGEKREFSPEQREGMAERDTAMEGGSYPISNVEDLKNAIQAIGRAKDPDAAKRHIRKRARALGAENLIPDSWSEKSGEPEDIETKVGRVLSNSNMGKLRQASELLNQVVSAGLPPAKPSMEDEAEEKKTLTGKVVHIEEKGEDNTEVAPEFHDTIAKLATKHDWQIVAPEGKEMQRLTHAVDIYLTTDDNIGDQMKELATAIEGAECELSVSVERDVKTISEVFQTN